MRRRYDALAPFLIWLLCLLAAAYVALRMLYCIFKNLSKVWVLAVSHGQRGNAACNGDPGGGVLAGKFGWGHSKGFLDTF